MLIEKDRDRIFIVVIKHDYIILTYTINVYDIGINSLNY